MLQTMRKDGQLMDEYIEKAKELFYLMSKMVIKSLPREKILYLLERT